MSAKAIPVDDMPAPQSADRRIAVAAHEIRTPLGGILALADLLLAEDLSEGARGHANALKAAAEHLFGLSTSLLGGAVPTAPKALDVDLFLARVSPPLAARAAVKGLAFRAVRAPGAPDRVLADEAALRQIVDNLADNALRATESGSVELAIERVSGDAETVTLRIALRDTGPGVGPRPELLFAPFAQGDGAQGAAGLGLAVVADLARGMGGEAQAFDRPSGGAEVAVTLRLGALDVRAANGPIRVLVAEDNAINQRVVGTLLEHFGHGFDVVENGAAAVAAVGGGDYDLVLMDAVMPTLDGLAATRAIRAMEGPVGAIRIVGLTARAFDEDIAAFLEAGADAVVTKPISVAELWRAIDVGERQATG
ncbi:response regulator [Chenggangzhangella methanolivorans]|uniref:histidine kinase n=1 Tax=Chenggangzhangella methanolivorans TaxID=1437009 RepID=A0A9E6R6K2_9HYPH|nr:response regulator [Chenggangzhangella methanolivorans]QZN98749.1 response regulator [Chenggangzhangella methanolivorans]